MVDKNTEATTDSTPPRDDSIATDSRTEEALLADIVKNSEFVQPLTDEQVPEDDTAETESEDPDTEEAIPEEIEEEDNTEESKEVVEDDTSTQDTSVFTPEELDLDSQVAIKIDGKETNVSFSDLIKGYSTEQSLSNKGRELGDARKQLENEFGKRFEEIKNLSTASAALLYKDEQSLAKEFHDLESKIQKARDEGDTYEINDLKDKREQTQKNYWNLRKDREALMTTVKKQSEEIQKKQWEEGLVNYNKEINTLIPDYNDNLVKDIREFALKEGLPESLIDTVIDPNIVKFVDDYRRLKKGINTGVAKRKAITVKKVPVKKAKSINQKKLDKEAVIRKKALSENSSSEDQMAFLKGLAERSLNNI